MHRIKQVILIRRDLKMRRGKEIAQGSHASMEFLLVNIRRHLEGGVNPSIPLTEEERSWIAKGAAKICLRVDSKSQLLNYHRRALDAGLKSYLIEDSGRTEFAGVPTLTACAIGPAPVAAIDVITGDLVPY